MWYTNLDPNLIRHGGRKAPTMSIDDCMALLEASMPDPEPGSLCYGFDNLYDMVYARRGLFRKAADDLKKVDVEPSNFEVEDFHMGANGVPYLRFFFGGDCEAPVYAALYFDGKTWRCYIPPYGNTYCLKTGEAFAVDPIKFWPGHTFSYWESPDPKSPSHTETFSDIEEWNDFISENLDNLDLADEAFQEDFSSRVEATGTLDHEACEKLKEKLEKKVMSWEEASEGYY